MKIIKIIIGVLVGLYSIVQMVNLLLILTHSIDNQSSRIGGAIAGLLIGVVISISLFKSALKKSDELSKL